MPRSHSFGNSSEGWDTASPLGRAAMACAHPVRRWALAHAIREGEVTTRDIRREWPALSIISARAALNTLTHAGYLRVVASYHPGNGQHRIFVPADLSDLHALHDELASLLTLSPTPEVTP